MTSANSNTVFLAYRPPYNWPIMRDFFAARQLHGNEVIEQDRFAKCMRIDGHIIEFSARHCSQKNGFDVSFSENTRAVLPQAISAVRKMLDLDADPFAITQALLAAGLPIPYQQEGQRLPSITNIFEAACRAIVGQQVSVKAAVGQLNLLQQQLLEDTSELGHSLRPFVSSEQVATHDLAFLKMPQARKNALRALAQYMCDHPLSTPDDWLTIKGIGPWTTNYVKMRAGKVPDVFLDSDLVIKKRCASLLTQGIELKAERASPWRSYLTLTLWNMA